MIATIGILMSGCQVVSTADLVSIPDFVADAAKGGGATRAVGGDFEQRYQAIKAAAGKSTTRDLAPASDSADVISLLGTDVVQELETLSRDLAKEFRRPMVFVGQLVFEREHVFTRTLHHETAVAIQRRLQFAGIPVIVLPIRVWESAGTFDAAEPHPSARHSNPAGRGRSTVPVTTSP